VIHGTGGHAKVVFDVARAAGYDVLVFVDPFTEATDLFSVPIVKTTEQAKEAAGDAEYFVAIGDNAAREKVVSEVSKAWPDVRFATLIHPSAIVSPSTIVGPGTVMMPGVVVNAASRVGAHAILNTRSSLDHDSEMADYASLAPKACTGGRVRIGRRSAVSIGAIVKHAIAIGDDVVIGAASYVNANIANNVVAYGAPATVKRERSQGDAYL
jgi:acetyltransferase EpsM